MQKGKEQRTMLPTLDMSKEGQFWDERKIVKSLKRFTSFPGLSVSLEPDPRSGDPEVKIMELDSGTHIAAHPTKAYQRPSLESIGRKLQLVEGLKAALNPSNLIESHHISVLKLDKSKDKEGDGKAHREDSVACDRIVRKAVKERSVMQELLESSSMGINLALDHEEKNDTGSMRSLVINDSTVGLQKQSESPSMSNDMVVSEPIRLPRENSLVILARAREEELQRRLEEANSANECTEEEEEEEIFICPRDEEGLTTNDYLRVTHFDYEILEASDKTMVHEVLEANDKSMVHEMLEANDKTMVHEILNANDKTMAHEMPEANDKTIVHEMLKANDKTMVCESGDESTAMKWHDTRDEKGLEMVGNYTRVPMFDKKLEANDKTTVHDLVGDGLMSMKSNDKVESNEPALMQREARIVRLAPTLLGSFNLEALQLAGMDNLYISIPSNHVDVSMAAPLHRKIIKPCDISKCSEGPDSSPRHVDPLNNLQSRLCILETTQEVHLLWGHIKCRSCLMALQIFLFIFVVFWGGVFDVQATPPPT